MYSRKISKALLIALVGVFVCGFSAESFAKDVLLSKPPGAVLSKWLNCQPGIKKWL